jgi:hypothetical protein
MVRRAPSYGSLRGLWATGEHPPPSVVGTPIAGRGYAAITRLIPAPPPYTDA